MRDTLGQRLSEKKLRYLYFDEDLSTVQIATLLGTNRESVRRLVHKYGLKMRSRGEGKR